MIISLILSAAICALWWRSDSHTDQWGRWRRWEDRSLLKEVSDGLVTQDGALIVVSYDRRFPLQFGQNGYDGGYRSPLPKVFDYAGRIREPLRWTEQRFVDVEGGLGFFGLYYYEGSGWSLSYGEARWVRILRVPYGFLISVLLIFPLLSLRSSIRERRRAKVGCCRRCGYDLRASPERCPECGEPAGHPTAT